MELVHRYDRYRQSYEAASYNETQTRREFIDPLFRALGWDVDNRGGLAEPYKDVLHEFSLRSGGRPAQAPDYLFRVGGENRFFVEAKKPSVNVRDDFAPAFQLRRYAWSAKLPISIVTDFAEFAVYDCRQEPVKTDSAATARLFFYTFDSYGEKWDEIAALFSRDAVLAGSLSKYAGTLKVKRGTVQVDDAFLAEIERWRSSLAQTFALRNAALTTRQLNFAVQQTIDRIVFLRICEDRGIEPYGQFQALLTESGIYGKLTDVFRRADERYNSGLFHFRAESGRNELPDSLTLSLSLDDEPLRRIIRRLYYPDSPYAFSVLPASILGQVEPAVLLLERERRDLSVVRAAQAIAPARVLESSARRRRRARLFVTPTRHVDRIGSRAGGAARHLAARPAGSIRFPAAARDGSRTGLALRRARSDRARRARLPSRPGRAHRCPTGRGKRGMTPATLPIVSNVPSTTEHQPAEPGVPPLDEESREWLRCLRAEGPVKEEAVARLHALLLRAALFEVARRRPTLPHLRGNDLDDIANQAADDALMSVLGSSSTSASGSTVAPSSGVMPSVTRQSMTFLRGNRGRGLRPSSHKSAEIVAAHHRHIPDERGRLS